MTSKFWTKFAMGFYEKRSSQIAESSSPEQRSVTTNAGICPCCLCVPIFSATLKTSITHP